MTTTEKTIALRDLRDTLDRCLCVAKVDSSRILNIVDQVAFAYVHYRDGLEEVQNLLASTALEPIAWQLTRDDHAMTVQPEGDAHPSILLDGQSLIDLAAAHRDVPVYFNWDESATSALLIQALRKSVWGTGVPVLIANLVGEVHQWSAMAVNETGDMYRYDGQEVVHLLDTLEVRARSDYTSMVIATARASFDGEPARSDAAYQQRRKDMLTNGMGVDRERWDQLWHQSRDFLMPFAD
ncbi:MAG: hypothetical protein Q4Q03_00815 [Bowdeniella nasicola]|nr:hypothetical protein [Bowdeniella nasicola]